VEHLEQVPPRFRAQPLDQPKDIARRDILLVVSPEGQETFANNDFDMLRFFLPVADISPINPYRERTIRDSQCGPIGGASFDKGPLLSARFVFTALRDRQGMVLHRRPVQDFAHREKILLRLSQHGI
jgi:hypothetical protein